MRRYQFWEGGGQARPMQSRCRAPRGKNTIDNRRLQVEALEERCLLSGVTLITHGFNSNADGWVTAMAEAIGARPDLDIDQALYRLEVTDPGHDGGLLEVTSAWLSGPTPTDPLTEDPEIALVLDWSDVAGTSESGWYTRSTFDVAAAVAQVLVSADFLPGLSQPLTSLPMHLIGHSRGGSLVGELAYQLGVQGIWVNQVTTLDPHPVDGINDPFDIDFGDAPMVAWNNVVFWDNYWRASDELLDFSGESVANTHNVHLDNALLETGGYDYEHSDVHLWYYGTVDTSEDPPANNGDEDVPNDWYGGVHPDRLASGYVFSRLVGGNRPPDGLAADLPGGLASREPVDATAPAWANVLDLQLDAADPIFVDGAAIPVTYYQQDADSTATITLALDTDRNPFNANDQDILQRDVQPSPTLEYQTAELGTVNVPSGTYHILATITDSVGHSRYVYAPQEVVVDNPNVNLPPEDILLDGTAVQELVSGVAVGHLTVVDPNINDTHTIVVSDDRFEVIDGVLKLKSGQSLNFADETYVDLEVTAIDSGQLMLDPPRQFVITVMQNPLPWHHVLNRLDVNGDEFVSPIDALRIINELNSPKYSDTTGRLPDVRPAEVVNYYDVYADGYVSPLDALVVINHLNQPGEGEGELAWAATAAARLPDRNPMLSIRGRASGPVFQVSLRRPTSASETHPGPDPAQWALIGATDANNFPGGSATADRGRIADIPDRSEIADPLADDLDALLTALAGDIIRRSG